MVREPDLISFFIYYFHHRSPAKKVLNYQLEAHGINLDDTLTSSSSGYKCINYGNGSDTCRPCPLGTYSGIKEDCTACPAGNLLLIDLFLSDGG